MGAEGSAELAGRWTAPAEECGSSRECTRHAWEGRGREENVVYRRLCEMPSGMGVVQKHSESLRRT